MEAETMEIIDLKEHLAYTGIYNHDGNKRGGSGLLRMSFHIYQLVIQKLFKHGHKEVRTEIGL